MTAGSDGQHQNPRQTEIPHKVKQPGMKRMRSMNQVAHHERTDETTEISQ